MSYVDEVANELADMALADEKASGEEKIVEQIGEILGSSSQTLQETYLTAIRVRRAETRARKLLAERKANGYKEAPKPKAAPMQGVQAVEPEPQAAEGAAQPAEESKPASSILRRPGTVSGH